MENTAALLKGSERRQFMARVVDLLGLGGQSFAERVLGWNRCTIRKGKKELENRQSFPDRYSDRGRNRVEQHFPGLLDDIYAILEPSGQTDPTFRSTRIYSPLSAGEIRQRLIGLFGYKNSELPCDRTLRNKLNDLGYRLRKVRKCRP